VFGRRIRQKSALLSRILFASTEVMHTPRSNFPLRLDVQNIYQIQVQCILIGAILDGAVGALVLMALAVLA